MLGLARMSRRRGRTAVMLLLIAIIGTLLAVIRFQVVANRPALTLAQFFGEFDAQQTRVKEAHYHERAQAIIVRCMKDAGFIYEEVAYLPPPGLLTGGRSNPMFKAKYGYGVSTLMVAATPARVSGETRTAIAELNYENERYHRRLLVCDEEAHVVVFKPLLDAEGKLEHKLRELEERVAADMRMQLALSGWSICMNEYGYQFRYPEGIELYLLERLDGLKLNSHAGIDPQYDEVELRALQKDELAIAAADIACRKIYVDHAEKSVRADLEPPFVQRNWNLLAILKS